MCHNPGLVREKPLGAPTPLKLGYLDLSVYKLYEYGQFVYQLFRKTL